MELSEIKNRIAKHHGDTVKIIESTFVGFKQKARFVDIEFGEWEAHVYAVCRGGRHKQRFLAEKRITLNEAQQRLQEKHEGKIIIKQETWIKAGEECVFVDVDFGEWTSMLHKVLNGIGHPDRVKQHRSESQKLTQDDIKETLDRLHDGKITLVGPYINAGVKCKFHDVDFGEFEASPTNVLYKGVGHPKRAVLRREETMMKHFGVRHHLQNDEQFLKAWKSRLKRYYSTHWKTCEKLVCTGKWELAFVEWCNSRQEDFLWQPKAFKMPDGKTYRPDAYLPARDLWVDIKGWYPEDSRKKCEWFKSIMPNFEVWFNEDLLNQGILSSHQNIVMK